MGAARHALGPCAAWRAWLPRGMLTANVRSHGWPMRPMVWPAHAASRLPFPAPWGPTGRAIRATCRGPRALPGHHPRPMHGPWHGQGTPAWGIYLVTRQRTRAMAKVLASLALRTRARPLDLVSKHGKLPSTAKSLASLKASEVWGKSRCDASVRAKTIQPKGLGRIQGTRAKENSNQPPAIMHAHGCRAAYLRPLRHARGPRTLPRARCLAPAIPAPWGPTGHAIRAACRGPRALPGHHRAPCAGQGLGRGWPAGPFIM